MFLDIRSLLAAAVATLGIGLVTLGAGAHIYFVHGDAIAAFIGLPTSDVAASATSARRVQQMLEGTKPVIDEAMPAAGAPAGPVDAANTALIGDRFGDVAAAQPGVAAASIAAVADPRAQPAPSGIGGPFVPVTPPRAAKEAAAAPPLAEPNASALSANASIAKKPVHKKKKAEVNNAPARPVTRRTQADTRPFKGWFDR